MRALGRGDTGAAMAWALKSQDAKFTTYLADRLLAEYATTGPTTAVLDLIFFERYCTGLYNNFCLALEVLTPIFSLALEVWTPIFFYHGRS